MSVDYLEIRQQWIGDIRNELAIVGHQLGSFVFEIGCGHGHFLAAYAAAFPSRTCIGIDRDSERVARARRKRDRAALANLHFLRADARLFLEALPASARISDVFILFPDPWPKLRHHKHRLMQPEFLSALADRLETNARLMFRTDHQEYFVEARQIVGSHPRWQLVHEPWPFEFETIFQQRAASHGSFVAQLRGAERIGGSW